MIGLIATVLLAGSTVIFPEDYTEWVVANEVTVEISRTGDKSHPWIRAHYTFPVDPEVLRSYLCDFDHYHEMFTPGVKKVEVLANGKTCEGRLHVVWDFPWPFRNRDGVLAYVVDLPSDDVFNLNWTSGAEAGDPKEGVRISSIKGRTSVKDLGDGSCEVTYEYLGNLGGTFPQWLKEAAWKGEPQEYFHQLRTAMGLGDLGQPWPPGATATAKKNFKGAE